MNQGDSPGGTSSSLSSTSVSSSGDQGQIEPAFIPNLGVPDNDENNKVPLKQQSSSSFSPPPHVSSSVSPSDLLPDRDRKRTKESCCDEIQSAGLALLSVPSDIEMLLTILAAYQREPDHRTILELGSRLGSSTMTMLRSMSYDPTKRFATVDLEIRQPVAAMYRCERSCSEASGYTDRQMITVQGNDLLIDIPFVDKEKEQQSEREIISGGAGGGQPYRPIDMLFIDTLHDASLLTMELQRYPRFVRRTICFHDSFSFYNRNEGPPNFYPPGWPSGKRKPPGLHAAISDFLTNHPEWVEEMNNVHNNGFFVIRRREVVPHLEQFTTAARYSGFEMEPPDHIRSLISSSYPDFAANQNAIYSGAAAECDRAYFRIYNMYQIHREHISPPCLVAPFSRKGFPSGMYSVLIRQPDDKLPIGLHLGVLLSQVTAANHYLGNNAVIYVWGCEFSVFVAASHGADQTDSKKAVFAPFLVTAADSVSSPDARTSNCELADIITQFGGKMGTTFRYTIPLTSGNKEIDVLLVSAQNIAKLNRATLIKLGQSVKHRVVVWGTSLFSVKELHEILIADSFELKINLVQNAGAAMWERKSSMELMYVAEAKKKFK